MQSRRRSYWLLLQTLLTRPGLLTNMAFGGCISTSDTSNPATRMLPNPAIKSQVIDMFMNRFVVGLKLKKALQKGSLQRYLGIAAVAVGALAIAYNLWK